MNDAAESPTGTVVVNVHNYGSVGEVHAFDGGRRVDVELGVSPSPPGEATERHLVCAWCKTPRGDIELTMLLFGQPHVTYTLTLFQASIMADALNEACR